MPSLQAVGTNGTRDRHPREREPARRVARLQPERGAEALDQRRLDPLLPAAKLEQRFGGVAIEMAGSVGSVETPEVFSRSISRDPTAVHRREPSRRVPDAVRRERRARRRWATTRRRRRWRNRSLAQSGDGARKRAASLALERDLGKAPEHLRPAHATRSSRSAPSSACSPRVPATPTTARTSFPVAPNGSTSGDEVKSQVAAFRIGDGDVHLGAGRGVPVHLPAELPGPRRHAEARSSRCRRGRCRTCTRRTGSSTGWARTCSATSSRGATASACRARTRVGSDTDRFGCGHSDDSEAASSQTGDIAGKALVRILLDAASASPSARCRAATCCRTATLARPARRPRRSSATSIPRSTSPAAPSGSGSRARGKSEAAGVDVARRPPSGPSRRETRVATSTSSGDRVWLDVFEDLGAAR